MVEQTAHNGLGVGSNPASGTMNLIKKKLRHGAMYNKGFIKLMNHQRWFEQRTNAVFMISLYWDEINREQQAKLQRYLSAWECRR